MTPDEAKRVDALERENTHLRLKLAAGGCPYGHYAPERGCELGYPGCACMDDLLALQAWCPEDEQKAAVRIGRLLFATRAQLDIVRAALKAGADSMDDLKHPKLAHVMRTVANQPVTLP